MTRINDMGEFVDAFDPNPDEQRLRAYASIRAIDTSKLRVRDCERVAPSGEEGVCPACGKPFVRTRSSHKYCSSKCYQRMYNRERRGRK